MAGVSPAERETPPSPSKSAEKKREMEALKSKSTQPPNSFMPFMMIMLCIGFGAFQFVEARVAELKQLEANWDPTPKNMADNEVIVLYCAGWAYEGTYRQVHALLSRHAEMDDLTVKGMHYPIKPSLQYYVNCMQILQVIAFLTIFLGESLRKSCNLPKVSLLTVINDNKMAVFMIVWLLGNMGMSVFSNSGAFEIYYRNDTVYSALKNGHRMPNLHDILSGAERTGLKLDTSNLGR